MHPKGLVKIPTSWEMTLKLPESDDLGSDPAITWGNRLSSFALDGGGGFQSSLQARLSRTALITQDKLVILAPLLTSCVILSNLLNPSGPHLLI